ncbi:MAG: hypothetical protein PHX83_11790 [Acidobacteriia bacterium]|nr:hypothetical protein [Terriglobia bacterium]
MSVSLETDRGPVALNPFVEKLCGNLLWGILESLHVPEDIHAAEIEVSRGVLHIRESGNEIPLVNPFAKNLLTELLTVLLRNLKGTEDIKAATFRMNRGLGSGELPVPGKSD